MDEWTRPSGTWWMRRRRAGPSSASWPNRVPWWRLAWLGPDMRSSRRCSLTPWSVRCWPWPSTPGRRTRWRARPGRSPATTASSASPPGGRPRTRASAPGREAPAPGSAPPGRPAGPGRTRSAQPRGHYRAILEQLSAGLVFEGMEQALPLLSARLPLLADLLPAGGVVVVASAPRTAERARHIVEEADALADASGWPGPRVIRELDAALGARRRIDLTEFAGGASVDLGIHAWEAAGRLSPMTERIRSVHRGGARVVVTAEGHGSLDRSKEVLTGAGIDAGDLTCVEADVADGFLVEPDGEPLLALVTEEDLFGSRRHT